MTIAPAGTGDIEAARELLREYEKSLGISLCFQNFAAEVAGLPGDYAPPKGRLLLAKDGVKLAGCVALRPLDVTNDDRDASPRQDGRGRPSSQDSLCEMKRLYVRPEFRGRKLGRELVERLVDEARAIGYTHMRLDTLPSRMASAVALYRQLGFREIAPYHFHPGEDVLFFELAL